MAYNYKSKKINIALLNNLMLSKTIPMFEYIGLPDSLPSYELEKLVQSNGYAFITKVDGELYAFNGGFSGEQDVYGNLVGFTVSNPALNLVKTFNIKKDGVLFKNDDLMCGLYPIFDKANTFLVENEINMIMWGYNSRNQKMITAPDDITRASADVYLRKLVDGDLTAVGDNTMF